MAPVARPWGTASLTGARRPVTGEPRCTTSCDLAERSCVPDFCNWLQCVQGIGSCPSGCWMPSMCFSSKLHSVRIVCVK